MIVINNQCWNISFVRPQDSILTRSDGSRTVGCTDRDTHTIYLSDMLTDKFLRKVTIHELTHAFCISYNIHIDIGTEEMLADFIATYGESIIDKADDVLSRVLDIRCVNCV